MVNNFNIWLNRIIIFIVLMIFAIGSYKVYLKYFYIPKHPFEHHATSEEVNKMGSYIVYASEKATKKYFQNRAFDEGDILAKDFVLEVERGKRMSIFTPNNEPILFAVKRPTKFSLPANIMYVGEEKGVVELFIIPKDLRRKVKIIADNGDETTLVKLIEKDGFNDLVSSKIVEEIKAIIEAIRIKEKFSEIDCHKYYK